MRRITSLGADIAAAPALARPLLAPPREPATSAPAPSSMAMIIWVCASASSLAQLGEMAAGEMAGFVREHADDLVRRLRLHHRAVIDEDAAAIGDEGVERAVVDDDHLDVLLFHSGGAQDRSRVVAQQLLRLGIAQDRRALVLLGRGHASAPWRARPPW